MKEARLFEYVVDYHCPDSYVKYVFYVDEDHQYVVQFGGQVRFPYPGEFEFDLDYLEWHEVWIER